MAVIWLKVSHRRHFGRPASGGSPIRLASVWSPAAGPAERAAGGDSNPFGGGPADSSHNQQVAWETARARFNEWPAVEFGLPIGAESDDDDDDDDDLLLSSATFAWLVATRLGLAGASGDSWPDSD